MLSLQYKYADFLQLATNYFFFENLRAPTEFIDMLQEVVSFVVFEIIEKNGIFVLLILLLLNEDHRFLVV